MAEGNGVDLGSIYGLLVEIGRTVSRHDAMLLGLQDDMGALKGDVSALKRDVASIKTEMVDMRQTVAAYHASVLGHGIMISELESRAGRLERHLDLPPAVHG